MLKVEPVTKGLPLPHLVRQGHLLPQEIENDANAFRGGPFHEGRLITPLTSLEQTRRSIPWSQDIEGQVHYRL